MPLENFEKYFNQNPIKDDAQEHMSELLHQKENEVQSRIDLYDQFEKIQSAINVLNSEIDELIPQQYKKDLTMTIAKKHAELNNYQRMLEDFVSKYPSIAEKDIDKIESIRRWMETKKQTLADLQHVPGEEGAREN